ncbi:unnamed protein product [Adineta steineri]|uniref:Uncharacterized protein n=1 Tax=Adineta steineri TaxID=433720 RepID=A0A814MYJ2_9BILA|nr:unnamed protein product [Adineta steineri]
MINSSTSCSIFPLLNCSCFQSNLDLNHPSPIKIYSHLHCQGNSLNKKTFQQPFGSDFKNQNHFRTISIEFFLEKKIEIQTNQFDSLSMLFSQTDAHAQIEISLRFNHFTHIKFHKQSITSNIFQRKHQNKRLWLHFIPKIPKSIQMKPDEDNSINVTDQFKFSENCFSGLTISQLNIYMYTVRDHFSSLSSFEHVFNNTNIGELHFHGSIIPPGPSHLRQTFKGLVRSLTLHRHVDTIDSNTFPYYFPVYSYNIHSIEAHSMDLNSFIPQYNNLRGLELIKPRFEVSIDKLIPTLDSVSLDIESLNERTLLGAQHIHNLKFGSSLRRINSYGLHKLSNRLRHLDLSEVNLSEMTPDSRCYLIDFIHKNYQRQLNLILPRIETLTECDCARLILQDIQLNKKFQENLSNDNSCSKQCRFSDCSTISDYFREKSPLFINPHRFNNIPSEINDNLPSVDVFSDSRDIDTMNFLINQTNINSEQTAPLPTITITSNTSSTIFQNSDDDFFTHSTISKPINENISHPSKSKLKNIFSRIYFIIGVIFIFLLIIFIISIVFTILRYRKQKHLKPKPVYV